MSPLILVWIFCFVFSSATDPSEISVIVDDIIAHGNEFIASKDFRNISLPDVANGNWFVKRHFFSSTLRDLATIKRIGDASMGSRSEGAITEYTIETMVGLESLEIASQYRIQFLWIFETSGHMRISIKRNGAQVQTKIVTSKSDGTCALLSKDVDLALLEHIKVSVEEGGFIRGIVARSVEYVLRFFVPSLIKVVNSELDEINQNYPLNPELTQYVCNYFI